jgi:hypothetical protein
VGAQSPEREAREIEREIARTPRARAVSDRIQELLDALPYPPLDGATAKRREQLEGYQIAMAYTLGWGKEISEEEYAGWMVLLAEPPA